jgi:hypothetical protein
MRRPAGASEWSGMQSACTGKISALGLRVVTATNVITTVPVLAKQ